MGRGLRWGVLFLRQRRHDAGVPFAGNSYLRVHKITYSTFWYPLSRSTSGRHKQGERLSSTRIARTHPICHIAELAVPSYFRAADPMPFLFGLVSRLRTRR
jgi:hypothetical protein